MYASTHHLPVEQQLAIAIRLFTKVRWIPPLAIIGGGFLFKAFLGLNLSLEALAQIAVWIAAYNLYLMRRQICGPGAAVPDLLRCANLHMFFHHLACLLHRRRPLAARLVLFHPYHHGLHFLQKKKSALGDGHPVVGAGDAVYQ
jgi:hypothetical protein